MLYRKKDTKKHVGKEMPKPPKGYRITNSDLSITATNWRGKNMIWIPGGETKNGNVEGFWYNERKLSDGELNEGQIERLKNWLSE